MTELTATGPTKVYINGEYLGESEAPKMRPKKPRSQGKDFRHYLDQLRRRLALTRIGRR